MTIKASSPEEYISKVPEDRKEAMSKLRQTILKNLPKGFAEGMNYNMIGYFVPHSVYPARLPLRPQTAAAFYKHCISEKFYCFLSHGHVR